MSTPVSSRERRGYWASLASLFLVVPLAIVVNSGGKVLSWLGESMERPMPIAHGGSGTSGGSRWQLAALRRLPGPLPDTNLILAEIKLTVQDAGTLRQALPCNVTLSDSRGRRWAPLFLPGTYLRETAPEAADLPQCSLLTAGANGASVRVAELYLVPQDAGGFILSLGLTGQPALLLQ